MIKKMDLSLITSNNWQDRKQAVESLAHINENALAVSLLDMVRNQPHDLNILNAALQMLNLMDAPVVPGLIHLLKDEDPEIQAYAALILGQVKSKDQHSLIIDSLLGVLNEAASRDNSVNLRFNIIEALGRLKARPAVDHLLEFLSEDNFYLSFGVIHALGEIGDIKAQSHLLKLLNNELLDSAAVSSLGNVGDHSAIGPIIAWLGSSNGDPAAASQALAGIIRRFLPYDRIQENEDTVVNEIGHRLFFSLNQTSFEKLLAAVPEEDPSVAKSEGSDYVSDLALVLGILAYTEKTTAGSIDLEYYDRSLVFNGLIRLIKNPNAYRAAGASLALIGNQVLPWLIKVLTPPQNFQEEDIDCIYRREAVLAMGDIGDPASVFYLEAVLKEDDVEVMMAAAESLGKIGGEQAAGALLAHLGHPSAAVRKTVVNALIRSHPLGVDSVVQLYENSDPFVKESALRLLASQKVVEKHQKMVVPIMLEAVGDPNSTIRRTALESLPLYDDPQIPSALADALHEREPELRAAAARSLGLLSPEFALPLLYEALKDPDPWVRMYACRSIANFGLGESLDYILPLLEESMPPIRAAAAEALGKFGGETAVNSLKKLLMDEEPVVQQAAEFALENLKANKNEACTDW